MRQSSSPISETVSQSLVGRDRAIYSVQSNGPRRRKRRLGRKIQAEGNAKLTLLTVGVLLQFCSAEVRGEINIRRLKSFPGDRAQRGRHVMVEKARHWLVISPLATRTLPIPQPDRAGANQVAIIAPQRSYMKRVDQITERRVAFFSKQRPRGRAHGLTGSESRPHTEGSFLGNQDIRCCQKPLRTLRNIRWHRFIHAQTLHHALQVWPEPERQQVFGCRVAHPRHRSLQSESREERRPQRTFV